MSQYWFEDISELFSINKLDEIFPTSNMSYPSKVNSLVRLTIYIGLLLSFIFTNHRFLFLPIGVMILTYILYLSRKYANKSQKQNNFTNLNNLKNMNNLNNSNFQYDRNGNNKEYYQEPTVNNPFMNAMPFDSRNRSSGQYIYNNGINIDMANKIEKAYSRYAYKDASDVFDTNSGRRQFFTNPNTTYPNNQQGFANWLYQPNVKTCKEGNGMQCYKNLYNGTELYRDTEINYNGLYNNVM